jgi:Holliday junction resolvase RusA-like endonuclease
LKSWAPTWCTTIPDTDNLEKACLDAITRFHNLTSLVWADDAQVVLLMAQKRYVLPNEEPGAIMEIFDMEGVGPWIHPFATRQ